MLSKVTYNALRLCLVPTQKTKRQLKINVIMKTEFDNTENGYWYNK